MAALKSATLFASMEPFLKTQGADMVKKVNAIFFFEIAKAKGETPECWTIDLKNGTGSIAKGKVGTADATFAMLDDDMIAMAQGKLNPQQAFMQGKMKIKGNMAAATKFTPDLLPICPYILTWDEQGGKIMINQMESGKLMQPLCSVDIYMLHLYQYQMI